MVFPRMMTFIEYYQGNLESSMGYDQKFTAETPTLSIHHSECVMRFKKICAGYYCSEARIRYEYETYASSQRRRGAEI